MEHVGVTADIAAVRDKSRVGWSFWRFGMNTLYRLALIGLAFAIPGCNSGGGEPSLPTTTPPTSPQPPPPPPTSGPAWVSCADQPAAAEPSLVALTQSPGGVWSGTLTNETQRTTNYFEATIGADGRFHFYTHDGRTGAMFSQFAGMLDTVGNTLAGTGRAYLAAGESPFDHRYSGEMEITGVVVERERFTAQWTSASGDSGCVTATSYYGYDYEKPSSGDVPTGTWTSYRQPALSLTTDAGGLFSGQVSDGCIVNGRLAAIDTRYGLYSVAMNMSGCATAGDYGGLAYFCACSHTIHEPPTLLLYINNDVRAIRRFLE